MTIEEAIVDFGSLESNIGILSYFDRFHIMTDDSVPAFVYAFEDDELSSLNAKYNLSEVVEGETGFRAVDRLMKWIHVRLSPGGSPEIPSTASAILGHADTGTHSGFSCDQYAVVLAESCLALGIPARITNLEPFNPNQGGNHVVVTAWDDSSMKWFLADAQFCCYYRNAAGIALDPLEIRDTLVQHQPLHPSSGYDYYGYWIEDVYRIFLARNLFSIACPVRNGVGPILPDAARIYLHPVGYDPIYRAIKNLRWYSHRDGKTGIDFAVSESECTDFARSAGQWRIITDTAPFMVSP